MGSLKIINKDFDKILRTINVIWLEFFLLYYKIQQLCIFFRYKAIKCIIQIPCNIPFVFITEFIDLAKLTLTYTCLKGKTVKTSKLFSDCGNFKRIHMAIYAGSYSIAGVVRVRFKWNTLEGPDTCQAAGSLLKYFKNNHAEEHKNIRAYVCADVH